MTHREANHDVERDLEAIAARLESERPVPRAAFRGDLRGRLVARSIDGRLSRRRALALVTAYAGAGLALLAVAAISIVGVGPLAA